MCKVITTEKTQPTEAAIGIFLDLVDIITIFTLPAAYSHGWKVRDCRSVAESLLAILGASRRCYRAKARRSCFQSRNQRVLEPSEVAGFRPRGVSLGTIDIASRVNQESQFFENS